MFDLWNIECPDLAVTEQRLLDQKRVIVTKQLLSSLELEHIQCSVRDDSRDVLGCSSPPI